MSHYEGRDATLAYFGQLAQKTGGTFRAELTSAPADDEDRVVGVQRSVADRDGKHLDAGCCIVFGFKDGRVVDGREHFHDLYAWDELWAHSAGASRQAEGAGQLRLRTE